jgi:hypothetical protein
MCPARPVGYAESRRKDLENELKTLLKLINISLGCTVPVKALASFWTNVHYVLNQQRA